MKNLDAKFINSDGSLKDELFVSVLEILRSDLPQNPNELKKINDFITAVLQYKHPATGENFFHLLFSENNISKDLTVQIIKHSNSLLYHGFNTIVNQPDKEKNTPLARLLVSAKEALSKDHPFFMFMSHLFNLECDFIDAVQSGTLKDKAAKLLGQNINNMGDFGIMKLLLEDWLLHDVVAFEQQSKNIEKAFSQSFTGGIPDAMLSFYVNDLEKQKQKFLNALNALLIVRHVFDSSKWPKQDYKTFDDAMKFVINIIDTYNRNILHQLADKSVALKYLRQETIDFVKIASKYVVEQFLKHKVDLNAKDSLNSSTPLHTTLDKANWLVFDALFPHLTKEHCEILDGEKHNALTLAAMRCFPYAIKALVKKGLDINIIDGKRRTPLIAVAEHGLSPKKTIITLLEYESIDLDAQDQHGMSALMYLIKRNYTEEAKILIEKGADLSIQDLYGKTALHWAMVKGNKVIFDLLIAKLKKQIELGKTPEALNINKAADMVDKIPSHGLRSTMFGHTPLYHAVYSEDAESASLLLKMGANPTASQRYSNTPAMLAFKTEFEDKVDSQVQEKKFEMFELLMKEESKFNFQDSNSTLHIIAQGKAEEYSALLAHVKEKRWNVDLQNNPQGTTPLMITSSHYSFRPQNLTIFLSLGADPLLKNKNGNTALHYRFEYFADRFKGFVKKCEYDKGARILVGAEAKQLDEKGFLKSDGSLHIAAKQSNIDEIKFLVTNGINPHLKNQEGKTALELLQEREVGDGFTQEQKDEIASALKRAQNYYFAYSIFLNFTESVNFVCQKSWELFLEIPYMKELTSFVYDYIASPVINAVSSCIQFSSRREL